MCHPQKWIYLLPRQASKGQKRLEKKPHLEVQETNQVDFSLLYLYILASIDWFQYVSHQLIMFDILQVAGSIVLRLQQVMSSSNHFIGYYSDF